jgi:two-component system sensor kinase FixL
MHGPFARPKAMHDPQLLIDGTGRIQSCGDDAGRLFGVEVAQLSGRSITSLTPWGDREVAERSALLDLLLSGACLRGACPGGQGLIVIGRRSDGQTFPMRLIVRAGTGLHQNLFECIIRDLTVSAERARREAEMRAELTDLARFGEFEHLTLALATDVVQPLAEIRHGLTLGAAFSYHHDDDDIHLTAVSLVAVTERLSDIMRRVGGVMRPRPAETRAVDFWNVIEAASGEALAGMRRALTMNVWLDDDASVAVFDEAAMRQVLHHLIGNAAHAAAAAQRPEIAINAIRVDDMIEMSIADNGIGLPAEIRSRLFHPLVTTKPGTTKPGGTGGGLAYCRAIIEQHGGTIGADVARDGGAVFRFRIPVFGI